MGVFLAPPQNIRCSQKCTKCRNQVLVDAVSILLLVILASTTGPYFSLDILQGFNPQPWLLKALVYHSATSAVPKHVFKNNFMSKFKIMTWHSMVRLPPQS